MRIRKYIHVCRIPGCADRFRLVDPAESPLAHWLREHAGQPGMRGTRPWPSLQRLIEDALHTEPSVKKIYHNCWLVHRVADGELAPADIDHVWWSIQGMMGFQGDAIKFDHFDWYQWRTRCHPQYSQGALARLKETLGHS